MTLSTVLKLISLADQILDEWHQHAFQVNEQEFKALLMEIQRRISLDGMWAGRKTGEIRTKQMMKC